MGGARWLWPACLLTSFLAHGTRGASTEKNDGGTKSYAIGDAIPVTCLERQADTGEHISDEHDQLKYIPFMTCNETGRPLEFAFGVEKDINCTLVELSDPMFHLLEFYIHNDAPLTCRIPSHPLSASEVMRASTSSSADSYIPLIFALSGAFQLSHLHVNSRLNVLLHTSPDLAGMDADILAASAYSAPSLSSSSTKVVIGDPLPLQLSVRWYTSPILPPSTTALSGLGGHVHISTVMYCLLSCGVGIAASLAYFRGVELPKRLRRHGKDRIGGERGNGNGLAAGGYAFPGSSAAALVTGGSNGYGIGKRD